MKRAGQFDEMGASEGSIETDGHPCAPSVPLAGICCFVVLVGSFVGCVQEPGRQPPVECKCKKCLDQERR